MDLEDAGDAKGLPDLLEGATSGASKSKTSGALEAAKEQLSGIFDSGDDDEDEQEEEPQPARRRRRRKEEDEE
jgi:hypothetical protein